MAYMLDQLCDETIHVPNAPALPKRAMQCPNSKTLLERHATGTHKTLERPRMYNCSNPCYACAHDYLLDQHINFTGCYQTERWVDDMTRVHGMLCHCSIVSGTC